LRGERSGEMLPFSGVTFRKEHRNG